MSAKHTGKHVPAKKGKVRSTKKAVRLVHAQSGELPETIAPVTHARRTDWKRLRTMPDEAISAQIEADPDVAPELDGDWFSRAEVREPRIPKIPISLRVDPDVLGWFKAMSGQYQSRMNAVLRAYMEHQVEKLRRSRARR